MQISERFCTFCTFTKITKNKTYATDDLSTFKLRSNHRVLENTLNSHAVKSSYNLYLVTSLACVHENGKLLFPVSGLPLAWSGRKALEASVVDRRFYCSPVHATVVSLQWGGDLIQGWPYIHCAVASPYVIGIRCKLRVYTRLLIIELSIHCIP